MAERVTYSLVCSQCKNKNYYYSRSDRKRDYKVEVNKYCKKCNKHTLHKEGKA
ncbi:MAG: 50S ribosomal protein L33 [Elusimicrobiales bacterium]|nr:50S ribosomal protein L33 [Elusimicrobiales bacterium]